MNNTPSQLLTFILIIIIIIIQYSCTLQENVFIRTHWLTGKDGYRFAVEKDVCVYIPKKVKLERIVVMKTAPSLDRSSDDVKAAK